jgi:hypothetical protein
MRAIQSKKPVMLRSSRERGHLWINCLSVPYAKTSMEPCSAASPVASASPDAKKPLAHACPFLVCAACLAPVYWMAAAGLSFSPCCARKYRWRLLQTRYRVRIAQAYVLLPFATLRRPKPVEGCPPLLLSSMGLISRGCSGCGQSGAEDWQLSGKIASCLADLRGPWYPIRRT